MWDAQTGETVHIFSNQNGFVWSVAFSPDGKLAATGSGDKIIRIWDTQTGMEIRQFNGHNGGVESVVFSPDGKHILSVGDDSIGRIWLVNPDDEIELLCRQLLRDLTEQEKETYSISTDEPTCP